MHSRRLFHEATGRGVEYESFATTYEKEFVAHISRGRPTAAVVRKKLDLLSDFSFDDDDDDDDASE